MLFVLLIPNTAFKLPIKNNIINVMVRGLIFILLFQITYGFISKSKIENLEVQGTNTSSLDNIINLIVNKLSKPNINTEYKIKNELIQVTPDIEEEYDIINDEKTENIIIIPPSKKY